MKCAVEACSAPRFRREWCNKHYRRWLKHGDPLMSLLNRENDGACSVDGCDRPYHARGFCGKHFQRFKNHGTPLGGGKERPFSDPIDRLAAEIAITQTGCFEWTGRRRERGDAYITIWGRPHLVHRVAYLVLVGPIKEGDDLHHLCENPACFNPDHLQPLPHSEHIVQHHRLKPGEMR